MQMCRTKESQSLTDTRCFYASDCGGGDQAALVPTFSLE